MSTTQGTTPETPAAPPKEGQSEGAAGKTYTEAELTAEADRRATAAAKTSG